MAGIFNGVVDLFTGGGGADLSQIPAGKRDALLNRQLDSLNYATDRGMEAAINQNAALQSQKNLLPFIYSQLGYDAQYGPDGALTGFGYRGTEAQNSLDALARQGQWSMPAQYANIGYDYRQNPDGSTSIDERGDSQRNQFLDASGRLISQSQGLYDRAYSDLLGAQGVGNEALNATRRQLQTAEASQVGALQQLGFQRDAAGNIVKNDGSPLSQYERMLLQQAQTARGTQTASLANLGYRTDDSGNVWFDPGSSVGQTFAQYDRLRGDAAGQTGIAQDVQGASLQRLGLTQDAQGNWANDPAANEMVMRSLQGDYLRRAQAAMQGNAPVDPGIERALKEEERLLGETMIRQLGPGWMTTSPGQEALRNFQQRANETRYRVQQDALGLGTTQAMGLQGMNLQTLASLYASNDPVLRAMAAEAGVNESALGARAQNASTASGISAQGANTIAQMAGTQSNINAQTLASLYGLTAPALAAAGQLGNQNIANQASNIAGYGALSGLNQATGRAVNDRATGALNFANSNAAILGNIPQAQQQLYNTANQGRMASLAALYPALQSGYDNSGMTDIMRVFAAMGGNPGATGLGINEQTQNSQYINDTTNMNNMFWRNMAASAGKSVGSMAGGMGGGMA